MSEQIDGLGTIIDHLGRIADALELLTADLRERRERERAALLSEHALLVYRARQAVNSALTVDGEEAVEALRTFEAAHPELPPGRVS